MNPSSCGGRDLSRGGVEEFANRLLDAAGDGPPSPAAIVRAASCAALACDPDNTVVACNQKAGELMGRPVDQMVGVNFQALTDAHDIFGNRLDERHSAFHEMVARYDALQSFKLDLRVAGGELRRVSVSIVVCVDGAGHSLVYLLTPMHRRRRADQLIDQLLAGIGAKESSHYLGEDLRGADETYHLTGRQKQVLELLAEGHNVPEISERLGLSVHTVRSHVQKILRTLDANTQLEAVAKALHLRLI